jgi:holliday junction resolvase YEN1
LDVQAPGEAEAELAKLNIQELIDAVVSEDVDALVFGAKCVVRMLVFCCYNLCHLIMLYSPNIKDAGDRVFIYTSQAIQSHSRVSLSREGLFLMAILCGGDYDKVGPYFCHVKH